MKRVILVIWFGLLTAGLASATDVPWISMISLPGGKSVEGGIAVNPVTHKAYVIAETDADGKVVFVLDLFDDGGLNTATPGKMPKVIRLAAHSKLNVATTGGIPKVIRIANENEYVTVDSVRNLIYLGTRFDLEGEGEPSGGDAPSALAPGVILGTLTVIDGNSDSVIATFEFPEGVEPEGVAVDPDKSVVYVAAKAPEGEAADDRTCTSGTPIPDPGEPADVECWTAGSTYAFFVDPAATPIITFLKAIPAGDDPEGIVFEDGMVYAANEDDGTVTIASAVFPDGSGGDLLTDQPVPPTQPYELGVAPYGLGVFYAYGPNPLGCVESKFEADKMAAGLGSAFITDDRSRVAKITGTGVVSMRTVPGATVCEGIPNTDGGGANTANNIAFMSQGDGVGGLLYVVSEQNTVAIYDPATMEPTATITVPGALHLDGIAVDEAGRRVWLTDEALQVVFVLEGACADGTAVCVARPTAPVITSDAATVFTVGLEGSFMVTAPGWPTPALTEAGALPAGVTFVDNGNGTATLAGTPAVGTEGDYPFTITAANGLPPSASQNFTLTVNVCPPAPAITTPAAAGAGSRNRKASVPAHAGSTYLWTIGNGTITAGQGTNEIMFSAGIEGTPLTLSVTETAFSGCESAPGTATVTVAPPSSALQFYTLAPCRLFDTRAGSGFPAGYGPPSLPGGHSQRIFVVAGECGIPVEAKAVSVNMTVWAPVTQGSMRIFPSGTAPPEIPIMNWEAGILALAQGGIVQLETWGEITVHIDGPGTVDIFMDVNGYFQ